MKFLFLVHRIPYPPDKGDKIRSFNEIKYLSKNHEIHLACLVDNLDDLKYVNHLRKYCKIVNVAFINSKITKFKAIFCLLDKKPLSVSYFYSKKLQKAINYLLLTNNYDAIICFSSPMAEYIFKSTNQPINQSTKLIMDFVDIDSDKWKQYAKYTKWPFSWIYKLESKRLAQYEKKVAQIFHYSIFVSKKEAKLFYMQNPDIRNILAIPNGVDFDYFNPYHFSTNNLSQPTTQSTNRPINPSTSYPMLLFTGAMDYYANVDGVVWFCKNIFPQLIKKFPELRFYIVGRNPASTIKEWANHQVIVTGYVEDIRPYYQMATIYVAPLRIARGIQNKILEAMAMAKPVVSTSKAFEGIEATPNKDLLLADSEKEFIEKITGLLQNPEKRKSLGISARQTVEKNYSWQYNLKILEEILAS